MTIHGKWPKVNFTAEMGDLVTNVLFAPFHKGARWTGSRIVVSIVSNFTKNTLKKNLTKLPMTNAKKVCNKNLHINVVGNKIQEGYPIQDPLFTKILLDCRPIFYPIVADFCKFSQSLEGCSPQPPVSYTYEFTRI